LAGIGWFKKASMKIRVAWIGKTKEPAIQALTEEYLKRIGHYAQVEGIPLKDEAALRKLCGSERISQLAVLLASQGREFHSQAFAEFIEQQQIRSSLPLLFAVGPASGFSETTLGCANMLLSLGKMTYAHEIARIVLLEQIYRAFTIIKRHPYHLGH
jgi:23S rRNA (pseudouridine1915-N3)-methyltransferase